MVKLVQIYFYSFNKITITTGTHFLALFVLLFLNFFFLDPDLGGKMISDPDPQP